MLLYIKTTNVLLSGCFCELDCRLCDLQIIRARNVLLGDQVRWHCACFVKGLEKINGRIITVQKIVVCGIELARIHVVNCCCGDLLVAVNHDVTKCIDDRPGVYASH